MLSSLILFYIYFAAIPKVAERNGKRKIPSATRLRVVGDSTDFVYLAAGLAAGPAGFYFTTFSITPRMASRGWLPTSWSTCWPLRKNTRVGIPRTLYC